MPGADHATPPSDTPVQPLKWWNTLAFRIALLINATVVVVLYSREAVDFTRERRLLLTQEFEKLKEEASVLAVTRRRLPEPDEYQSFLDDFCRQMSASASPRHHILALGSDGAVALRAHVRADPQVEARMIAAARAPTPLTSFEYHGEVFLVANVGTDGGLSIVVAQSLAPMLRLLRARAIGRLVGVGALALLIFMVTGVGLWFWIRRPLRQLVHVVHQVGEGQFQSRANGIGSAEVHFLSDGIDAMARSLGRIDDAWRTEMERARKIQQRLLPPRETRFPGLMVFSAFVPTTSVAGDLFDCIELADGSVAAVVIDVSGHGVPAALYTALLRTVLRYEMNGAIGLDDLLTRTNRQLHAVSDAGDFATCFVARIAADRTRLEFAKAGHDPAILLRAGGDPCLLDANGLPLGVEGTAAYEAKAIEFRPADRLILYTDGLHEVFDAQGNPFGRERLARLAAKTAHLPAAEQVRRLITAAQDFQGAAGFADDVTLVCVHRG